MILYALILCAACLNLQARAEPIVREVSQASIKFLDDLCTSVKCKETNLFGHWNFTKTSAGLYAVSPCQDTNQPVGPSWQFITCSWPAGAGSTSTPANITAIQFTHTAAGPGLPLQGTIPNTIDALIGLEKFIFTGQGLRGMLPKEIGALRNLSVLNLENNHLYGTLPGAALSNLTKMSELRLTNNFFHGPLAGSIFAAMPLLEDLRLARNVFTSTVPASIGNLNLLKELSLNENRLSGPIPSFIPYMAQLRLVDLSGNLFVGPILPSLNKLAQLKSLSLSKNSLSGVIPLEIFGMVNLTHLDLSHNVLSGSIDPAVGMLTNIQFLILGDNKLSGALPQQLSLLTNLIAIDLTRSKIGGPLPTMFASPFIERLELAECGFTGPIPQEIFYPKLFQLSIQSNLLTGSIPWRIAFMTNLRVLNLDHNSFTSLPSDINRMFSLRVLTLQSNKFSGAFGFCQLSEALVSVDISDNPFVCYDTCWSGESAIETSKIPNCNVCPPRQYTGQVTISSRFPYEGMQNICMDCPPGTYSFLTGAQSVNACMPCPEVRNPFDEINPQCRPSIAGAMEVKVGSKIFAFFSFFFCVGTAGLAFFLGILVYRRRLNCTNSVHVHFFTVIMKMTMYGFVVFSDIWIAIALLSSFVYAKFGAIILLGRLSHVVISGNILLRAYRTIPNHEKEIAEERMSLLNSTKAEERQRQRETESSIRARGGKLKPIIPADDYAELIDQEGLNNPLNYHVFAVFSLACLMESQLLQFMPWKFSRFSCEHRGFPDANTYGFLGIYKFIQSTTSIVSMLFYLADTGKYYGTAVGGISALFALNIALSALLLVYNSFIEPIMCELRQTEGEVKEIHEATAAAAAAAAIEAGKGAGGGMIASVANRFARKSVVVNTGDVYGGGKDSSSDSMMELGANVENPMAIGAGAGAGAATRNAAKAPPAPPVPSNTPPPAVPNLNLSKMVPGGPSNALSAGSGGDRGHHAKHAIDKEKEKEKEKEKTKGGSAEKEKEKKEEKKEEKVKEKEKEVKRFVPPVPTTAAPPPIPVTPPPASRAGPPPPTSKAGPPPPTRPGPPPPSKSAPPVPVPNAPPAPPAPGPPRPGPPPPNRP